MFFFLGGGAKYVDDIELIVKTCGYLIRVTKICRQNTGVRMSPYNVILKVIKIILCLPRILIELLQSNFLT